MNMEDHEKHPLGYRAFFLFLLGRIRMLVLFAAVTFAAWYAERWLSGAVLSWDQYFTEFFGLLALSLFLATLLRTLLEYRYYTYTFTEHAFVVTQGYIVRDEVATLYHQIQNVNIKRSPVDRMIGISQLIILMSGGGHERQSNHIIIPALGRKKAVSVQKELLARARKQHEK